MLTTNVIAIDLAKNVRQICYISVHGELLLNKALADKKLKSSNDPSKGIDTSSTVKKVQCFA